MTGSSPQNTIRIGLQCVGLLLFPLNAPSHALSQVSLEDQLG